jgi:hypothetical protein
MASLLDVGGRAGLGRWLGLGLEEGRRGVDLVTFRHARRGHEALELLPEDLKMKRWQRTLEALAEDPALLPGHALVFGSIADLEPVRGSQAEEEKRTERSNPHPDSCATTSVGLVS